MKKFYLVCLTLLSFGLSSDVTVEQMSDIESRVGSMSLNELQDRRSFLTRQERQLDALLPIAHALYLSFTLFHSLSLSLSSFDVHSLLSTGHKYYIF